MTMGREHYSGCQGNMLQCGSDYMTSYGHIIGKYLKFKNQDNLKIHSLEYEVCSIAKY